MFDHDISKLKAVKSDRIRGMNETFFNALVTCIAAGEFPTFKEFEKMAGESTDSIKKTIESLRSDLEGIDSMELSDDFKETAKESVVGKIQTLEDQISDALASTIELWILDKIAFSAYKPSTTRSSSGSTASYWAKYNEKFALFTGYPNERKSYTNGRSLYMVMTESMSDEDWAKVGVESFNPQELHLIAWDGKDAEYLVNLGKASSPNSAIQSTIKELDISGAANVGLHPSTWDDKNSAKEEAGREFPKVKASLVSKKKK